MGSYLIEHRIRIRNRADNADFLTITSVRGDTYPYLKDPPTGDGQSFNPLTNASMSGSYTGRIVDVITSGTSRIVTANLEDVNNRLQLGYLKTYVGWRQDGGSWNETFGFLTSFRLVSDIEWEFTIQDPSIVYDGFELFNTASSTSILTFINTTWPNRACLLGGPVKGTWMHFPDLGGWTVKVHRLTTLEGHLAYWLEPVVSFGPGAWTPQRGNRPAAETAEAINAAVRTLPTGDFKYDNTAVSTIADAYSGAFWWAGLVYLIDGAVFRPIPPFIAGVKYGGGSFDGRTFSAFGDSRADLVSTQWPLSGLFAYDDGQNLSEGAVARVRALTVLPTEVSPILLDRHPVDHLTDCWTLAGLSYNAAACTTLKETIGSGLRHAMIVRGSRKMGDHLREAALQFGIATRTNAAAEVVPFSTRIFSNTAPTKTITDALVVAGTTRAFDLDALDGLQRVTMRQKLFTPLKGAGVTGIKEGDVEYTLNNGLANPLVSGTIEISTDGMLRPDATVYKKPVDYTWLATIAEPLFDRFGAGCQEFATDLIRGDGSTDADTINLGDEVLVNVKQIPNHNKRYGDDATVGARALQVIQITELVDRRRVRLKDSGPNAQALATKPTHTIAASSDRPRTVAEVTITNAAALNALAYAVVVQIAVTTGATPATTDYVDFYRSTAAATPTGAIRLPGVVAGRKVYVRARSEKGGSRPSDWSTGVGVTLTAVAPVTGLAATTVVANGSNEDLAWTVGVNDCYLDVYVRASGAAFSTAIKQAELLPGSTRYRLNGLTPNTAYTASVQHRDAATQDVSALAEVTFTTANATYVLLPPIFPDGFSFPLHVPGRALGFDVNNHAQRYGIAVVAQEYPGTIEVAEAVEDSVGAGTYGAYTEVVGRVPAISGDYTLWSRLAPQDGLRRKLKARSVGDGQTTSAYCDEVIVDPASVDPIATFPLSIANFKEKTRASTTITVQWENNGTAVEIWLFTALATQPVASDQWPSINNAPTVRLTSDTTEYTFDIPDQNSILYGVIVPVGANAVAGVPWRFTLQPSTQQRVIQRAKIQSTTAQSCVVRVEIANPIPGGDVTISYVTSGLTVSPSSPQTITAANVPIDLNNSGGLTNYVDFTVTRPAPGANDRVTFTAASTDRTSDVDAIDIPALDGIPQGVIAIPAGGTTVTPTAVLDGAAWVASYKYAESTSAFPSDATARAGTTANGRQVTISLSSALALGDSVYVTALPYSVTAAGGIEGASIRLKATRHDFSATKTVRFAANRILPTDSYNTAEFSFPNNYAQALLGVNVPTSGVDNWQGPDGATLTKVEAELYTPSHDLVINNTMKIALDRLDATGGATNIGSVTSTDHNGWETLNFTCSESTTGRQYRFTFDALMGQGSGNPCAIAAYYVTYSMPNSLVAL